VEDSATVLMEYPSGMRAIVDVRWNSRVQRDELRIIGSEGELELTPGNDAEIEFRSPGENWKRRLTPCENLHYPMIENFVSAVLDGTELVSSGRRAAETDRVITAAYESARTGRRIDIC
jgi:predicted dehydrogenase